MKTLLQIALLAVLWVLSGATLGAVLSAIGVGAILNLPSLSIICAAANGLIGLALLRIAMSDREAWRVFVHGPDQKGGHALVGCLWVAPIALFLWAIFLWIGGLIARLVQE